MSLYKIWPICSKEYRAKLKGDNSRWLTELLDETRVLIRVLIKLIVTGKYFVQII